MCCVVVGKPKSWADQRHKNLGHSTLKAADRGGRAWGTKEKTGEAESHTYAGVIGTTGSASDPRA